MNDIHLDKGDRCSGPDFSTVLLVAMKLGLWRNGETACDFSVRVIAEALRRTRDRVWSAEHPDVVKWAQYFRYFSPDYNGARGDKRPRRSILDHLDNNAVYLASQVQDHIRTGCWRETPLFRYSNTHKEDPLDDD